MINRPNISQLITSKYGRPASSLGVSGTANREARNEAYRASVDSLMDQQPEYRQEGGGFSNFFSGIFDYATNFDPQAASGEGLLRDFGEALSPKTFKFMNEKFGDKFNQPTSSVAEAEKALDTAIPAGNSQIKVSDPTTPTTPTTEQSDKKPMSENLLLAVKEVMPEVLKTGVTAGVKRGYQFKPTAYATSGKRRASPKRSGLGIKAIPGSGFKDGGALLGRDLYLGGGEITGPGGPKEDLVPIWASDDEYVVSADAVTRLGDGDHSKGIAALDRINFG